MEDGTSVDFDGNSDSGIVTGSDSQSEGTAYQTSVVGSSSSYHTGVAGSTTSSYHTGVAGSTSSSYHTGVAGSTSSSHHTGVAGSKSSSYHTGVAGSTTSSYHTGVAGSTSSGYHSGVDGSKTSSIIDQPKLPAIGQIPNGPQVDTASQKSGFSTVRSGQNLSLPNQFTEDIARVQKWINSSESTMMEDLTLFDIGGNSDSGVVTGSDSQSVSSVATLIGSPTPKEHGGEGASSKILRIGETNHQTSVVGSTSSGYHSGVVGSTSSGYYSGVVGSTSSGYNSGVVGSTASSVSQPPKSASVGQNQDEASGDTESHDSGISSMTSEQSQSLPMQFTNDGKRTQEWINNSPFDAEVILLDGRKTTIQVKEDETVTSFKEKVHQRYGIAANDQRLISGAGRSMADNKLLKDYEIRKTPKIYCQWAQRGG